MPAAPKAAEFGWPGGDIPGALRFDHQVPAELAEALGVLLAPEIGAPRELQALSPCQGAIGRYAATAEDGREWFVRVSARWVDPALEQAITGYLQSRGVPVNHLVAAGLSLAWEDESLRVDIRPRLHGRHFDGSRDDLRGLAEALSACHVALRDFPEAAQVRERAASRFTSLETTRSAMREELARGNFLFFCQDESWGRAHREWLATLLGSFEPRYDLLAGSQCVHGQIHQANVLYAPGPVLVDWEEAVQTYAPVQWDLAYFVQRFCLHDGPSPEAARERVQVIREAYGAPLGDIAGMMRQAAWLSTAILVDYRQRGIESPLSEYAKFVRLEEQARGLAPLLEEFAA